MLFLTGAWWHRHKRRAKINSQGCGLGATNTWKSFRVTSCGPKLCQYHDKVWCAVSVIERVKNHGVNPYHPGTCKCLVETPSFWHDSTFEITTQRERMRAKIPAKHETESVCSCHQLAKQGGCVQKHQSMWQGGCVQKLPLIVLKNSYLSVRKTNNYCCWKKPPTDNKIFTQRPIFPLLGLCGGGKSGDTFGRVFVGRNFVLLIPGNCDFAVIWKITRHSRNR